MSEMTIARPTMTHDGYRTAQLYTIGEAARFAKVSVQTVRRWLFGTDNSQIVLVYESDRKLERRAVVSFLQLLELRIARDFRREGRVSLERVRRAHAYLRENYDFHYPFASLPLATIGGRILQEFEDREPGPHLVQVGGIQAALPGLVQTTLYTYDFADDDVANRWHPVGRTIPIVIDPYVSAGVPTVEERRVTVQTIYKRERAGQSLEFMSRDLDIEIPKLKVILHYARDVRLAA